MTTLAPPPTARGAAVPRDERLVRLAERVGTLSLGPTAAAIGALAALITWLGSWNPSYWGDEAATVMSAQRPLTALFAELGKVDAVHGLYYFGMHFWIRLFGASELSTRLPSALAVGAMVAGTVVLGARLAEVRFGILAGVVCAVLPRTTFMATEARSYAMGTALAVWIMVFFVDLWRRREFRRRSWVLLGVLVAAASYLFLYLVLLAAVQGVVLLATTRGRPLRRRWLQSLGVTAVVVAPIAMLDYSERHQIAFLARRGYATAQNVLVDQWFGMPGVTVTCWALILLGVAVFLVRWRKRSTTAVLDRRRSDREVLLLGTAWLVLPTALLLAANAVSPTYNTRYLSFCTPAAALLVAFGLAALARVATRLMAGRADRAFAGALPGVTVPAVLVLAVAVFALGALALPDYLHDRGAFAKDGGSDWRQTADYLAMQVQSGDAVVFDETTKPSRRPELAYRLYPQQFAGVTVPELITPYSHRDHIWDLMAPITEIRSELLSAHSVWAIELPTGDEVPADVEDLTSHGYRVVGTHLVHRLEVYQLQKEGV
ncbi:MAG TPA: glycosyltransferase family 39 protein [Pseudolysinimonas sp.]